MIIIMNMFHTVCQQAKFAVRSQFHNHYECFTLCVDRPSLLFTMRNQSHDHHHYE